MKAMILAAGRGERMMPLTANMPKPMLKVGDKPLMQYHIEKLAQAGITDLVINLAWCGEKIIQYFADGKNFGVDIFYSDESSGALETAGGIIKALPLLTNDDDIFLVVNGDIYTDFTFTNLPVLADNMLAHLWLVDNPPQHPAGDFYLADGKISNTGKAENKFTFSGIALYRRAFFSQLTANNPLALGPLIRAYAEQGKISATKLAHFWADIGTPERLLQLENKLQSQQIKGPL